MAIHYVTAWYAKTLGLFQQPGYAGEFAFVSTNSITQGEPVPTLFRPIFAAGWRIKFAHRTFAWTSEAPGAAAVYCVVIGFDHHTRGQSRLWHYPPNDLKGKGQEINASNINGYLADAPNVMAEQRRDQLSPSIPGAVFGNVPRDGGCLIVEPDAYAEFAADPYAAKYLRPYVGARELINGGDRHCLWLTDLDPADVRRSEPLRRRIEACRTWRLESKAQQARDAAETPQLFWYRSHRDVPHLVIPRASSETRNFLPCAYVGSEVISSDGNCTVEDPDGFAFAVVSSSAFMAWQRAVGGRLKSDYRFSNTLTWNTFPLPAVTDTQRAQIIEGGKQVLAARELHPDWSLAQHYDPLTPDPALLKAHAQLDRAVDAVFGLKNPSEAERLAALFKSYEQLTTANQLPLTKQRRTPRKLAPTPK